MAGISKKLRFEIFKRDGFMCQYYGYRHIYTKKKILRLLLWSLPQLGRV